MDSKTLISFLLGAATGVAIGYFLAAENKEEIIENIKSTADRVRENIEKGRKFVDEMTETLTHESGA